MLAGKEFNVLYTSFQDREPLSGVRATGLFEVGGHKRCNAAAHSVRLTLGPSQKLSLPLYYKSGRTL